MPDLVNIYENDSCIWLRAELGGDTSEKVKFLAKFLAKVVFREVTFATGYCRL
jgi:hypothetical protein